MITINYSISVNLYCRKIYIFVIKIKTLSYISCIIGYWLHNWLHNNECLTEIEIIN
ncbi:hypothetical protein [Arsenophonus endosymbiont of Bemisia tabaci]|uniref:hypothetical protein n=1 Tax=Arsenophonus endosymbiont of Bemisia tabaci TaxID=536059 RepID=UPI0015F4D463|nr:hypothetical protein [Arsenophonus endosymbiont of Bemisia tabaci]